MNLISVIILLLVVCLATAAIHYMVGNRKNGCGSCDHNCAGCGFKDTCSDEERKDDNK